MKKNNIVLTTFLLTLMVVMVLSVSGCFGGSKVKNEPQVVENVEPTVPQTAPPTAEVKETAPKPVSPPNGVVLYDYSKIGSYEYKITSTASGATNVANINYKVSSSTFEGQAVWALESNVETEGVSSKTTTYISKANRNCVATESETLVMGQSYKTKGECNTASKSNTDATGNSDVTVVGTESVTVPAGTFTATKYQSKNGGLFWLSTGIAIPVKFSAGTDAAGSVGELVSYS
ncbi:MAG: hypothetical protein AABX51_08030 [Nanoarchaeota archaeon]